MYKTRSVCIYCSKQETQLSLTNRATRSVADLLKTRPSPYVLLCRIWLFCVKGCSHKYRRTPKNWRALKLRSLGMRGIVHLYSP